MLAVVQVAQPMEPELLVLQVRVAVAWVVLLAVIITVMQAQQILVEVVAVVQSQVWVHQMVATVEAAL